MPTTKLFLLLLRQLGKKKRELIWGSKGRAGLDGLGRIRVRLYVMPCARGHGCHHPIDYGSPAAGKIRPRFSAAGVIFNDELSRRGPTSGFGSAGRAEAGGPLGNGPRAGIEKGM